MNAKIIEFTPRHTEAPIRNTTEIETLGATSESARVVAIDSLRRRANATKERMSDEVETEDEKFQKIFEIIAHEHPDHYDNLQAAFDDYMIGYTGKILPQENRFMGLRRELLAAIGEQLPDIESYPDIAAPDYPIEPDNPAYNDNVTPLGLPRR